MAHLSRRLALAGESQDWGIVNANAARLDEFLEFYESQLLTPTQRGAMAGPVLAFANERLEADPTADLDRVARTLPRIVIDAEWDYHYWCGLNGSEFPLAHWLRRQPL